MISLRKKINKISFIAIVSLMVLSAISCSKKNIPKKTTSVKKENHTSNTSTSSKDTTVPIIKNKQEEHSSTEGTQSKPPKPEASKLLVNFVNDEYLSDVLEKANKENKLIFLEMYTTWCQPCKTLDQQVFTDPEMANFLNKNFINMKVNAEKGNGLNLSGLFSIKVYPTLIFLDTKGNIIERKDGMAFFTELYAMGRSAIATVGKQEQR